LRQRLDFMDWYTGSLITFTDNVCKIVRKYFPETGLAMPIGFVHENLSTGQIKSLSAKTAAKYNIVSRWTGLAHLNEFDRSNICARRISSAARYYGGKFGVEAALIINKENAANAIYETLSNSSSIFHNDPGNILRAEGIYEKYRHSITNLPVKCNVAVYYPIEAEMCQILKMESVYDEYQELRRYSDYEIADSYMITDGFLSTIKELVFPKNCLIPEATSKIIEEWIKNGGTAWYITGNAPRILENNQVFNIGEGIENWNRFGKNDGYYYTDHGDKFSKYDPKNKSIEILNK